MNRLFYCLHGMTVLLEGNRGKRKAAQFLKLLLVTRSAKPSQAAFSIISLVLKTSTNKYKKKKIFFLGLFLFIELDKEKKSVIVVTSLWLLDPSNSWVVARGCESCPPTGSFVPTLDPLRLDPRR